MYGREHGCSWLPGLITLQRRADSLPLVLTWKIWRKVWFVWLVLDAQSILNGVIWYMHGTWEPIPVYLVFSKLKKLSSLLLLIGLKYAYKTTLGLKFRETGEGQLKCSDHLSTSLLTIIEIMFGQCIIYLYACYHLYFLPLYILALCSNSWEKYLVCGCM